MSAHDDILEHNLQRLFSLSYVPVACEPSFRARLARVLETELSSRSPSRTGAHPAARPMRRQVLAWAAAAIVLMAIGAWIAAFFHSRLGTRTLNEIMASGSAAVRDEGASDWRALRPIEAQRGLDFDSCALSVATPAEVALALRFGSRGQVELEPRSRADVGSQADSVEVRLDDGGVRLERYASGPRWTLAACGADVELVRGSLRARIADAGAHGGTGRCLVVALERGEAHAQVGGARSDLRTGMELVLQDGRALAATVGIDETHTALARTALDPASAVADTPAGAPNTAPAGTGLARLEGTLSRADGGDRPRHYTVTCLRHERLPAVSTPSATTFDASERFVYEGLPPGEYDVFVEADGAAVWHQDNVVLAANATRTLDVQLVRGATLRGRVVSAATGAPLYGATVIAEDEVPAQVIPFAPGSNSWKVSTTTQSDGTFAFENLGAGAHTLRATMPGFGAAWSAQVDASRSADVVLRLEIAGALQGRVAHDDGTPWDSAIVIASFLGRGQKAARFGYGFAIADAEGRYAMGDLPAGDFVLLNALDAHTARSSPAAKLIHVDAGATTIANLPETSDGSRVHGRVLDDQGVAIASMDVTLQPRGVHDASGWRSRRADEQGQFEFGSVPAGTYDVFVGEGLGERFVQQDILEVPRAGDLEHDIHLDAGAIRGRATRAVDGEPIKAGFLLLEVLERGAFTFAGRSLTNADGTFAFERLHPDTYRVTVFPLARGLAPAASGELWIARAALDVRCDLKVEPGAALRITVRDAHGVPVPGAAITFVDAEAHAMRFTASDVTGPDGTLDVPGIGRGRWTVSASHGDARATVTIELEPGDERNLTLAFER